MKSKKRLRRLLVGLTSVVMMLSMSSLAHAEDNNANSSGNAAVDNCANGIVEVQVAYNNGDEKLLLQTGTAFLINQTTAVTCAHVVQVSDESKARLKQITGKAFDKDKVVTQIVPMDGDYVDVKAVCNDSYDFAVLTFQDHKVDTRKPLVLGDSNAATRGTKVNPMGFPAVLSEIKSRSDWSSKMPEDVLSSSGTVAKSATTVKDESGKFIVYDADTKPGMSGGPLVDSNGAVVGIVKGTADDFGYAIMLDPLYTYLDNNGISYEKADGTIISNDESEEESEEDSSDEEAITTTTTAAPVVTTTVALPNEDEESSSPLTAIIIICAVVAAILIALIIIFAVRSGKKKEAPKSGGTGFVPPPPPQRPVEPNGGGFNGGVPTTPPTYPMQDDGGAETSLLNEGGETSVLGGAGARPRAMLVRRKNGTSYPVNKAEFTIGKQRSRVDCCINNNAISRQHAKIISRNGMYFITDLNSSNYTYVNGNQVAPNEEMPLNPGDIIKLADEEFDFRG